MDTINQLSDQIDEKSAQYEKMILSQEMHDLLISIQNCTRNIECYRDQITDLDQQGKDAEALDLMNTMLYLLPKLWKQKLKKCAR